MKRLLGRELAPTIAGVLLVLILLLLPTGHEDAVIYKGTDQVPARVLTVDNSAIFASGLIQYGEQHCTLELLRGNFRGQTANGVNMLSGSLDTDKIFLEGDKAFVVVNHADGEIRSITMIDHYRLPVELLLAALFIGFLILFAGKTGVRAVLSFLITILSIWKVLVPALLAGANPVGVALLLTVFLTIVIILLVYGFDARSLAASSGAILGVLTTCALGIIFTNLFQVHGAVMDYSETLLYSGYMHLNLTELFKASIFLGASGAVMDLAVDITSSVGEVLEQAPHLTWFQACRSGMNVGRAAMGTMTTTLLFAYSGGYLLLMMVFMAQGTPVINILNYKNIAAELLHTIVGSFGLVTVAPFTALTSAFILKRSMLRKSKAENASAANEI